MNMKIVIANRNTLPFLKLAVKSINQNQKNDNEIFIYDDHSTDGSREWLEENTDKFNFSYSFVDEECQKGFGRLGITGIMNKCFAEHEDPNQPIFWAHSDMVFGKDFDVPLLKLAKKGKVVSSTRIEPSLYAPQPEVRYQEDLGIEPDKFNQEGFDSFVSEKVKENKGKTTDGVFAPSLIFKQDWDKIDGIHEEFWPQSREDCVKSNRPLFLEIDGVKKVLFAEEAYDELAKMTEPIYIDGKEMLDVSTLKVKTIAAKENGELHLQKMNKIWRRKVKKPLVTIRTGFGETVVTEDHSLIDKNLKPIKYTELTSENVWKPNNFSEGFRKNLLKEFNFNGITYSFDEYGGNKKFSNLCRFFGAYCAEGYTILGKNGDARGISLFTNNEAERDEYVSLLKELSGVEPRVNLNKKEGFSDVFHITVANKDFAEEVKKNAGRLSKHLFVPEFVLNAPVCYQKQFLFSYIRGDGHVGTTVRSECKKDASIKVPDELLFHKEIIRKCCIRSTSQSKKLTAGVCYLLKRIYKDVDVNVHWREEKSCYDIRACFGEKNGQQKLNVEIGEMDKEEYVYDLEIKGLHTFIDMIGFVGLHNSNWHYEMKLKGVEFIQAWDSLVYHFSGRGSRKSEGVEKDSEEWKFSNQKNERNFARIYKELPRYSRTHSPTPSQVRTAITLCVLTKNNESTIKELLQMHEPFFDQVVIVDDNSTDNTISLAEEYFEEESANTSLVKKDSLTVIKRALDGDFAAQRNAGNQASKNEWVFHLDADEYLEQGLLNMLNRLAVMASVEKRECVAFPRKNYLEGVLVNDIPREKWTKQYLKSRECPKNQELKHNADFQCRLVKRGTRWVRPVHEMPEPYYRGLIEQKESEAGKVKLYVEGAIMHMKTVDRQNEQNKFYDKLVTKKPDSESPNKKIIFNSVLFSDEGITRHGREEAKQLKKRGWDVKITSQTYQASEQVFRDMNAQIDADDPTAITYVNQPPIRPNNVYMSLAGNYDRPNLVYYLAYEGDTLPPAWASAMKHPSIKKVLTPSDYCKKVFENHGIEKVEVLEHGFDPEVFNTKVGTLPFPEKIQDKFVFLFAGTYRGDKNDRKGLHVMIDAWKKFKDENQEVSKDCALVLKLNKIYFQGSEEEWKESIGGLGIQDYDVVVVENSLDDDKLASLIRSVNCTVLPSLAEGFGLFAMESLACGTPVIASDIGGFRQFLNEDNALFIDIARECSAQNCYPYHGPGWEARWKMPSKKDLAKKLAILREDYDEWKQKAMLSSEDLKEKYSWDKIGEKLEKILLNL